MVFHFNVSLPNLFSCHQLGWLKACFDKKKIKMGIKTAQLERDQNCTFTKMGEIKLQLSQSIKTYNKQYVIILINSQNLYNYQENTCEYVNKF